MSKLVQIALSDILKTIVWGALFLFSLINTMSDKTSKDKEKLEAKINSLEVRMGKLIAPNGYIYSNPSASKAMTEVKILKKEVEYLKYAIDESPRRD